MAMNQDLTTFIIKELSKHPNRKEVVRKVCRKGSFPWKDAERLVILVEAQHKRKISEYRSQSPLLLFISIAVLLLGIGLLIYNLQTLFVFSPKDILGQISGLRGDPYGLIQLGTGLGMTIGGVVGLWKALGSIFPY
jgi:hypothetical protein